MVYHKLAKIILNVLKLIKIIIDMLVCHNGLLDFYYDQKTLVIHL